MEMRKTNPRKIYIKSVSVTNKELLCLFKSALSEYEKEKKQRFKKIFKTWFRKSLRVLITATSFGSAIYQFWGQNSTINASVSIAIGIVLTLFVLKKDTS